MFNDWAHKEKPSISSEDNTLINDNITDPPTEDDWVTKMVNFFSGGAVDEARAILAFEATNPSTTDRTLIQE